MFFKRRLDKSEVLLTRLKNDVCAQDVISICVSTSVHLKGVCDVR